MLWLRAVIVYVLVVLLFRFLGRGLQLHARPYDVAVEVLIGSAGAHLIVAQEIPIWPAFASLGTLALLHTALSFLSLWNPIKRYLIGEPSVLMENGAILKANLIKHQINVEDLMAALRQHGYRTLADVEFALLESSGKLSVIPRSQARPVTPRDLGISTPYEGYSATLISDGEVLPYNLQKLGLDQAWLEAQLPAYGASQPSEVLLASLNTQGQLLVVRNQDVPLLQAVLQGVQGQTGRGMPPIHH